MRSQGQLVLLKEKSIRETHPFFEAKNDVYQSAQHIAGGITSVSRSFMERSGSPFFFIRL